VFGNGLRKMKNQADDDAVQKGLSVTSRQASEARRKGEKKHGAQPERGTFN